MTVKVGDMVESVGYLYQMGPDYDKGFYKNTTPVQGKVLSFTKGVLIMDNGEKLITSIAHIKCTNIKVEQYNRYVNLKDCIKQEVSNDD